LKVVVQAGTEGGEADESINTFLDTQRKLTPFLKLVLLVMYEKAKVGPPSRAYTELQNTPSHVSNSPEAD
jgi:hypothetical protein